MEEEKFITLKLSNVPEWLRESELVQNLTNNNEEEESDSGEFLVRE